MGSSAFSIAVSALQTHSYAIDITAHNIANAGTPGYRRERLLIGPGYPHATGIGMLGSGVRPLELERAGDRLADERARRSGASYQLYANRAQIGALAEDVFGEPDRGINTALNTMFDAFSALSTAPTDTAARTQAIASLQELSARVNDIRAGLDGIAADAVTRLDAEVQEINALTRRVAEINRFSRPGGSLPADIADELEVTLDKLSEKAGASVFINSEGRARVSINGRAVVDGDRATPLTVSDDIASRGEILHPSGSITIGGSAGGVQEGIVGDLAAIRDRLDTFVSGMVTTINDLHATGFTVAGDPGQPLFEEVDGRINLLITDPADLAASGSATGPLSGSVADSFAQLRTTVGAGYRAVTTYVSNAVASLDRSTATAQAVNDGALQIHDSIIGVNLDEELTNMLAQQRAYEAAARVITVADEMLQTLLAV